MTKFNTYDLKIYSAFSYMYSCLQHLGRKHAIKKILRPFTVRNLHTKYDIVSNIYNICGINLHSNYAIIVIHCNRAKVYMVDFINIFDALLKYIVTYIILCLKMH